VVSDLTAVLQKTAILKNYQLMRPDEPDWWKSNIKRMKGSPLVMDMALNRLPGSQL
jgi:hypothetical protein